MTAEGLWVLPFGDLHIKKPTFVKIKTVKKDEFVVYYAVIYFDNVLHSDTILPGWVWHIISFTLNFDNY